MSDRVWHKGPPRFPGWWNASVWKDDEMWRWWDGNGWSEGARSSLSANTAARIASLNDHESPVLWTDYWPENARVPRLDPTGGHWTFNVDGKKTKGLPERIDLVFRDGGVSRNCSSAFWRWDHRGLCADILAWRPAA